MACQCITELVQCSINQRATFELLEIEDQHKNNKYMVRIAAHEHPTDAVAELLNDWATARAQTAYWFDTKELAQQYLAIAMSDEMLNSDHA